MIIDAILHKVIWPIINAFDSLQAWAKTNFWKYTGFALLFGGLITDILQGF